ncbi:MAG TPA: metal-dependent hydrolase [Vicinamibacteria bacterium]|nr:metal-dependent hydrolase [Vicinamibacteria bacterium]
MEPVTHGLLGAALGQALVGRRLGRPALAWGVLACMLPDVDVAWMNRGGPLGEFVHHRGFTHSVWFGPVVGPLLALLAWRAFGRERGRRSDWIVLFVAGIFAHPLLDICTTYGTQFLVPFSDRRFRLDAVAIVDPAYSLILAVAIVAGLWLGVTTTRARAAALGGLLLSTAYLAYGYALNERVRNEARAQLAREGMASALEADVRAYPTLLQLYLRRVVVRPGPGEIRVAWVTAWRSGARIEWESFDVPGDPRVEAARATPEGRTFEWFTDGQTAGRVRDTPGGPVVEIDDLRFGFPGQPELGLWGLRWRLSPEGVPQAPVQRFNRPLPASAMPLVRRIFREAFSD